ncbi:MAG: hypothetical protein WKI04_18565 [Ferruginibacter sp.]
MSIFFTGRKKLKVSFGILVAYGKVRTILWQMLRNKNAFREGSLLR